MTITQAGQVTAFVYDGLGRRVQEKLNGTLIKQWIWADAAQPAEERDASGNVTRRFYAGLGEQIGTSPYYYTQDHLGSVREMTDSAGAVRARYDYGVYGKVTKVGGDLEATFGFTGHYRHTASGLNLTLYRAYDADLGRWLSRDPIGESGGINLYEYVGSDPINSTDPLGLFTSLNTPGGAAAMAWMFAEVGMSAVDVVDTAKTLIDPCSSRGEKVMAAGLFAAGIVLPGGGYSKGDDIVEAAEETIRVRHYTNAKGLKGIEESNIIKASDQNRVFAESANRKPLSQIEAETQYGIKPGRGRNYVETDVPTTKVVQRYNPSTGANELVIRGDLPLQNPTFTKRP